MDSIESNGRGKPRRKRSSSLAPVRVRNPVGLDLDSVLPPSLLRYRDHARYLIHTIHRRNAFAVADDFVPLKAEYITDHFPGDPVRMRVTAALIVGGAIERDECYTIGRHSKGYRLGPACVGEFGDFFLDARSLLKEIVMSRRRREAEPDRFPPAYGHVRDCLKIVRIDRDAALADLETMKLRAPSAASRLGLESGRIVVNGIQDDERSWDVDDFGNRAHHDLSRINAPLRRHLTVNGESLMSLDVTSSQPIIIGKIARKATASGHAPGQGETAGREAETRGETRDYNDLRFTQPSQSVPDDVIRFIALCESGELYDEMAEKLRGLKRAATLRNGQAIDREYAKRMFLSQVLFGENHYRGALLEAFARMFPTVNRIIREIKRTDFTNLCRIAQREESRIIFVGAVERCRLAGLWVATVHDCLLCLEADVERVKLAMKEAFAEVGLSPKIKPGSFSGPPASEWKPRRRQPCKISA